MREVFQGREENAQKQSGEREYNAFLEPQITHLATAKVVCQGGKVGR